VKNSNWPSAKHVKQAYRLRNHHCTSVGIIKKPGVSIRLRFNPFLQPWTFARLSQMYIPLRFVWLWMDWQSRMVGAAARKDADFAVFQRNMLKIIAVYDMGRMVLRERHGFNAKCKLSLEIQIFGKVDWHSRLLMK